MTPILLRNARTLGLWIGLGFAFTMLLASALPVAFGGHGLTVRSGSMSPVIETGDVVVTMPVSPLEAHVGDIVTFRDPEGGNKLYTHRVREIERVGPRVEFVTRGDANTTKEHWSIPVDGSLGRVAYRVPRLGYVLAWGGEPLGRIALIAIPALFLCGIALGRIWRSDPDPHPEPPA
jgi:signal peptidase I